MKTNSLVLDVMYETARPAVMPLLKAATVDIMTVHFGPRKKRTTAHGKEGAHKSGTYRWSGIKNLARKIFGKRVEQRGRRPCILHSVPDACFYLGGKALYSRDTNERI